MFSVQLPQTNARDYKGDLVGREIMVDAANHRDWFETVSKGSGLDISEIFRVKSVEFGWINFYSDRRIDDKVHTGRFCGTGEMFRFNVVEP